MITINVRDGQTVAEQTTKAPTVYLDQWAWSRLSQDDALRERFLAEANAAQPTLLLSLVSFLELAQQRDEKQLREIKAILDSIDFGARGNQCAKGCRAGASVLGQRAGSL